MADWVHCNKCFRQPMQTRGTGLKYNLTNCAHIVCDKCIMYSGQHIECVICHRQCTTIVLTANLTPDIEQFFAGNPIESLEKYQKITEFQRQHRERFFNHMKQDYQLVGRKYEHAKEHIAKMQRIISSLEQDNQRLRNYIKTKFGQQPTTPAAQTPNCNNSSSYHSCSTGKSSANQSLNHVLINGSGSTQLNSTRISLRPENSGVKSSGERCRNLTRSTDTPTTPFNLMNFNSRKGQT